MVLRENSQRLVLGTDGSGVAWAFGCVRKSIPKSISSRSRGDVTNEAVQADDKVKTNFKCEIKPREGVEESIDILISNCLADLLIDHILIGSIRLE